VVTPGVSGGIRADGASVQSPALGLKVREPVMSREALQASTVETYDRVWRWWVQDSTVLGLPIVPTPEAVRIWLLSATSELRAFSEDLSRFEVRCLDRSWAHPTAAKVVAGLDHHMRMAQVGTPAVPELADLAAVRCIGDVRCPGKDPEVRDLLSALGRIDRRIRHVIGRDAMSIRDLKVTLDDLDEPGLVAARDFLATALSATLGVSPMTLVAVQCCDVSRRGVRVAGRVRTWAELAAVHPRIRWSIRRLAGDRAGDVPLFRAGNGDGDRRMSGNGLGRAIRRLHQSAAQDCESSVDAWWDAAATSDLTFRLRAAAVLCVGWWGALRREPLGALLDQDAVAREGKGMLLKVRRKGPGTYRVALPWLPADQAHLCPVRRLMAWQKHRGPGGKGVPVFPRVGTGWKPADGEAMSGEAVNDLIRLVTRRAGVTGNIGAHSLRVGLITEVLVQGGTLAAAAVVSGHRYLKGVRAYVRPNALRYFNLEGSWRFEELSDEEALVA
jgi:hypothetical protein